MSPGRAIRTLRELLEARTSIVIRRQPERDSLAWATRRLIHAARIDLVIDVGAHHGDYGHFLRDTVQYRGRIRSLEPASGSFDALTARTRKDALWEIERIALGAQAGEALLHTYKHSYMNSLLPVSTYGSANFAAHFDESQPQPDEMVTVRTLGEYLANSPQGAKTMLKLDTQGHDLPILQSGASYLRDICGLQLEIPLHALYEGSPTHVECFTALQDFGFDIVSITPVSRSLDGIRLAEVDCLAINRSTQLSV